VLAGEHYNLISRLLQQQLPVKLRVNVQSRFLDDRQTYNVLAEIPGTDPALKAQVVMMGAHLDSWHAGTGATDNADGAVAALEAFRILKAIGVAPKRTIRLAIWSGEEEGLLGSKAYVRDHLDGDAHKAERDRMDVYLNIDPGKGKIYGWYLENNEAVKPIFDAWLAPFTDLGAVRNVRQGIGSTDHLSFIAAGVPGFNPVQDYVDYDIRLHHTNADTSERVDLQDVKQNAVVLASFLYHAANRAEMIPTTIRK
jgi:Zn-dependent M28 family amino/carboxypeptidase